MDAMMMQHHLLQQQQHQQQYIMNLIPQQQQQQSQQQQDGFVPQQGMMVMMAAPTSKSPTLDPASDPQQPSKKKTTGPIHNPRYKSILCDHWERNNGTCPYAEKCQFAHGPAELAKWQAHRQRQQQALTQQLQQQQLGHSVPAQASVQQQQQFTSPMKPQQQQYQFVSTAPQGSQQQFVVQYIAGPNAKVTPVKLDPQQQMMFGGLQNGFEASNGVTYQQQHISYGQQQLTPNSVYSTQQQQLNGGMTVSPVQSGQQQQHSNNNNGMFSSLPPAQYGYGGSSSATLPPSAGQKVVGSLGRAPSPSMYPSSQSQQMDFMRPSRQTPVGSTSSTPPGGNVFAPIVGAYTQTSSSSRRSVSPDNQSLELRSHQDMMDAIPRSGTDPRRTASLPQLFSRDFLSSLSNVEGIQTQQNQQMMGTSSRLPNVDLSIDTLIQSSTSSSQPASSIPNPSLPRYSSSRRGSAPPVVLSGMNGGSDYNSLADLDSLADELVSEPPTASAQLFNMPTVFSPGPINNSIAGSINEYL